METSEPSADEPQPQVKGAWARPMLTYLGNLRDIVHGFGKTGANADPDPQMGRKPGVG